MTDAEQLDDLLAAYGLGFEEGPPGVGERAGAVPVMVAPTSKHWARAHGRPCGRHGYKLAMWEEGAGDGASDA